MIRRRWTSLPPPPQSGGEHEHEQGYAQDKHNREQSNPPKWFCDLCRSFMFKNVRLTPRFEVSDEPVVEQGEQGIDMTAAELRQIAGKMRWYVRCREGLWGDDPEATRMAQRCDDTAELLDRASGLTDADIKPILGGPHVDEATGRVWQPEDTDKATGPFVIGKLAQDRIASRRRRRSSMVKTFPTDQA